MPLILSCAVQAGRPMCIRIYCYGVISFRGQKLHFLFWIALGSFPMEKVFESYVAVAALLQKRLNGKPYFLSVQDTTRYLFDGPKKTFQPRPDPVILRKADGAFFIADTKWKLLDAQKPHYGISQSDLYQMAVYQYKYHAQNVTLLYPRSDAFDASK